jgi:outer membrane protein assembly factor BamB
MSTTHLDSPTSHRPLRLWPGIVAALLLVLVRFVVPVLWRDIGPYAVLGGLVGAALILLWWLFFSRAPWIERIGALLVIVVATLATKLVVHPSIAGGLMGMMVPLYAVPITLGPVFVAWAVATRHLSDGVRRATMVLAILIGCGVWTLIRTDGIFGESGAQFAWRWTPTAEERLLAKGEEPVASAPAQQPQPTATGTTADTTNRPAAAPAGNEAYAGAPAGRERTGTRGAGSSPSERANARVEGSERTSRRVEWPGFRGERRDGVVRGIQIDTDWTSSPPVELWRRPVGPGWSSFAVRGDLIYTQEQRGGDELVSAYRLSTGQPVWRHRNATRFYESNGGPGPRGTPAITGDRIYTLGATGIVNALDADTGAVIWWRNAKDDTGATLPGWGFCGSPLVVNDLVIVPASGRLAAYEVATGKPRWTQKTHGGGYSSPHLASIDGVEQLVMLSGGGATGVSPSDGKVLWEHAWAEAVNIVQPAFAPNGDLLLAAGDAMGGLGIRRVAISHNGSQWGTQERWTTRGLKPYFNDFVVHKGYAFGFDGSILSCIEIETGERKWKGGRYGAGQLVLLPDQDLLLVLSEEGELALVSATADQHKEIARFKAIEGKTWNHPVLVGDTLLVRNGEEMAAFRLKPAVR